MIVFDLGCEQGHRFEGWYSSNEDYECQRKEKLLECPLCGSQTVERLVTAARVNTGSVEASADSPPDTPRYANFDPARLLKMVTHIVENTEDVGRAFPEEVRRIHYKEAPDRHIRGTASVNEVVALRDEGIAVVPLPLPPHLVGKLH